MKRTVISKSSKKKMSSSNRQKANTYTEMVVYRQPGMSITKHEAVKK